MKFALFDKGIRSLPQSRRAIGLLLCVAFIQSLFLIVQAFTLSHALTNLWLGQEVFDQSVWLIAFLFTFVLQQILNVGQESFLDYYTTEQSRLLRQQLLKKVFTAGPKITQAEGAGSISALILEGIERVETYLSLILPKSVRLLIVPLVLLVVVFVLDWVSGLILLIIFPFVILYMVILGHNARENAAHQHESYQRLSNHFLDSLRGIDTLKYFGRSKQHASSIFETSERFRKATMRTLRTATLSGFALDLFATLSLAAVAIMLGLRLMDGSLLLFPSLMVLILAPEYFKPIREFASDYHASLEGSQALSAIRAIINEPVTEQESEPLSAWSKSSQLVFDNVSFSYSDHQALRDISLTATGFQKIGVVGLSGSGKSTLLDVLSGFLIPDEGTIKLNGTTAAHLKRSGWQNQVALLPQSPYLFSGTVRENIMFYFPSATPNQVDEALKTVGLEQLVHSLPEGLDTNIGEGGHTISGGEAQRIALARLVLDPSRKVLLFDEPTAHLDIETELELKERMLPLMENRLVIFATHRLHWMQNMDYILVMQDGKIVESGPPSELAMQQGAYRALIDCAAGEVA